MSKERANNKKTILIVEDEESLSRVLVDGLTQEDFATRTAKNGEEGLEVALREHPDLILLDIIMPVMDGMTMLDKLRKDVWGKNAKIIVLTNLDSNEKIAESIRHGAYDYLVKTDWKIEDVIAKVRERLAS
ncbi:MAG: two-component system, OmpR family, alkaline phosphatase synthesis response regulator PhoP [Parcubacteria group bacterium Greene0416_14]|nr:MAG: two-component system, OmpR family, alkaline phosphatase synthesis response regulator PhoP [Parcubacteria group bacterium Greene0416_14]TSC99833.1 MAG: two-component system, OmpR family, alkaline phosphatase synthesis response regulator PhoP [Parcubacteria group bacterium Greene1014_15]TSD07148.1 MAG: two-component system, OmpR family, alkaline phosphatase synthesis response regulator PhoP [Parcubacteria group bacterium Greene0714_4]